VRLRGGRYGRARVERELKARGFPKETIAAAFAAEGGAQREDEALRRAFAKLWKARAHMSPPLRRRRVFDALSRRGFPAERISEIIRGWYEVD
jgi:SOS response regulatory protein OraA/RecX